MSKGRAREIVVSKWFHRDGIPVLVSPGLLRSYGLGQIDLVKMIKRKGETRLVLLEVKSSQAPSRQQWQRLRASAQFLAEVFNCSITLDFDTHENLF